MRDLTPEAQLAVHDQKHAAHEKWQEKHEQKDDERHSDDDDRYTAIGKDLTRLITGFGTLNTTLEPIVKAYWGEESSKLTHVRQDARHESVKPKSFKMSPEVKQGGIISALLAVVLVLTEVIKALIHPAPPSVEQITTQIVKELAKQKEGK